MPTGLPARPLRVLWRDGLTASLLEGEKVWGREGAAQTFSALRTSVSGSISQMPPAAQ